MERLKDTFNRLLQGPRRPSGGPTITTHPEFIKIAQELAAKGHGIEALEELFKAAYGKHINIGVAAKEQQAIAPLPEVLEQLRQHQQDAANEEDVVKGQTEMHEKHKASDLELFVGERCPVELKARKRQLKTARHKARKSKHTFKDRCKQEGLEPTEKPLKMPSVLGFGGTSVAIFGVEACANYEAMIPVFRSNLVSTVMVALGCSLGVTMLAKFIGRQLAEAKKGRPNRAVSIALMTVAGISTGVFAVLVGGTRAFGDIQHPIQSWWGQMAAMALNLFLFIGMVAIAWAFHSRKALAEKINALLGNKLKWEKAAETLQAEVDALELATIDKKIEIEHGYRPKFEEAQEYVRNSGIKVAKVLGEHHARLAGIDRDALIASAGLREATWGLRLYHQLGSKAGSSLNHAPIPDLDPGLFTPTDPKTIHPVDSNEVSPNP